MKLKITYRKLGKEQAHGLAHIDKNLIEIDSRLRGKKQMRILIHEIFHIQNPDWSESKVDKHSTDLANLLWREHYRKTDNKIR